MTLPEDLEPLLAGDPSVPSIYGEEAFLPGDESLTVDASVLDEEMLANGIANSLAVRATIAGGLWNGDFRMGPPRPDEPLSESNPLPFWRVGSGQEGGVRLYWEEYGSAGRIRGEGIFGAVDQDEMFIEQVIPVHPRQRYIVPSGLVDTAGIFGTNDLWVHVVAKPFDATGAAQNSGVIAQQGDSRSGVGHAQPYETAYVPMLIPDAGEVTDGGTATYPTAYALIKFIFRMDGVGTVTSPIAETRYLFDAYAGPPRILSASSNFVVEDIANAAENWYTPSDNFAFTGAAGGVHHFLSQHDGWIEGIGVSLSAGRTSGTLGIAVYDYENSVYLGPVLAVDGNHTGDSYAYGAFLHDTGRMDFSSTSYSSLTSHDAADPRYNWFRGGQRLRVRSEVLSGTWAPTTADAQCTVTFAAIDEHRTRYPNT